MVLASLSAMPLMLGSLVLASASDLSSGLVSRSTTALTAMVSESYKLVSDEGKILFEIPGLRKLDALALDPAGIFWVYSRGTLYSYGFSGECLSTTLVTTSRGSNKETAGERTWEDGFEPQQDPLLPTAYGFPVYLEPNPIDGSVWLAQQKNLVHVDSNGDLIDSITLHASVNGLAFDAQHDRLYIATGRTIMVQDAFGRRTALGAKIVTPVRDLAYDPATDSLWVVEKNALTRYKAETSQALLRISAKNELERMVVIPGKGLWIATYMDLIKLSDAGQEERRINSSYRIPGRQVLALFIDPFDDSLWVAGENTMRQFDPTKRVL